MFYHLISPILPSLTFDVSIDLENLLVSFADNLENSLDRDQAKQTICKSYGTQSFS